jgi:CRISPR/Cas system CSM-associated protein Csm3 (group 7 of RAMP superfamily)
MAKQLWSAEAARRVEKRIVVEGTLVLETPAQLGNGDSNEVTDMPLLVDPGDGKSPLLTGATIAGALRSYLRARLHGNTNAANEESSSVRLFGGLKGDDTGEQSPLIVEDAIGVAAHMEVRAGVRIDGTSRTAKENYLYDARLWSAGTTFPLRFELLVRQQDDETALRRALATALEGFSDGGITLGARKRRGYGQVQIKDKQWQVRTFKLREHADLLKWLDDPSTQATEVLSPDRLEDHRAVFEMQAVFTLDGSLLIRSGGGRDDIGPDMVQLQAHRPDKGGDWPIVSGTSVAGALRARALKIANTIKPPTKEQLAPRERTRSQLLIESMWGTDMDALRQRNRTSKDREEPRASRVLVEEQWIEGRPPDLVQSRVSIDRFTGGARDTALFNEQPLFGDDQTVVKINVKLLDPRDGEMGLLLLLLKDLWTGDLPLGGESSVGRGRLKGQSATLKFPGSKEIEIKAIGEQLNVAPDDRAYLQRRVEALHTGLKEDNYDAQD